MLYYYIVVLLYDKIIFAIYFLFVHLIIIQLIYILLYAYIYIRFHNKDALRSKILNYDGFLRVRHLGACIAGAIYFDRISYIRYTL